MKLISRVINCNSSDDSNNNDDDDDTISERDVSIIRSSSIIRVSEINRSSSIIHHVNDINPLNNSISSEVELQINRSSRRIENEV